MSDYAKARTLAWLVVLCGAVGLALPSAPWQVLLHVVNAAMTLGVVWVTAGRR